MLWIAAWNSSVVCCSWLMLSWRLTVFLQSADSCIDWWLFSLWLAVFSRSLCCFLVDWCSEWLAGCSVGFCMCVCVGSKNSEKKSDRRKDRSWKNLWTVDVGGHQISLSLLAHLYNNEGIKSCMFWEECFMFVLYFNDHMILWTKSNRRIGV